MSYNFYGWERALVQPVNNVYNGIDTPQKLYDALSEIWCSYTCAPRLRDKWSKENIIEHGHLMYEWLKKSFES